MRQGQKVKAPLLRRRQKAAVNAAFPAPLLRRLMQVKAGRSVDHLFDGMPPTEATLRARLEREASTIRSKYFGGLDEEDRRQPNSEYVTALKAARNALKLFVEMPASNYILNERAALEELGKTSDNLIEFANTAESLREIAKREIGQALWWLETLNIHADAAILSGKRGIESPALGAAEFAILWHSGFWKSRCGLTQKEFHDLAEAYWIAAGLPDKGNAKKGNTLRAYIRKAMKNQEKMLEKLTPFLLGN